MNLKDDEFEKKFKEFIEVLNKAFSELDDNELYIIGSIFSFKFNHIHDSKEDAARNLLHKMREYRKDAKDIKELREYFASLKALI